MSTSSQKKPVDTTRLGECAALQPLSGVTSVEESFAVNGTGRGGYARTEEPRKPAEAAQA